MGRKDWSEERLPDGRIRWSKEHVTIEQRGERKFWVRVQISKLGYSRQGTLESRGKCENWANNRLAEKEALGADALPSQREIIELRRLKERIGEAELDKVADLWALHNPPETRSAA